MITKLWFILKVLLSIFLMAAAIFDLYTFKTHHASTSMFIALVAAVLWIGSPTKHQKIVKGILSLFYCVIFILLARDEFKSLTNLIPDSCPDPICYAIYPLIVLHSFGGDFSIGVLFCVVALYLLLRGLYSIKEPLINCHFERSEKSICLIYKDSSLRSE